MPTDSRQTCLIWGAKYEASVMRIPSTDSCRVDSCRAGGKYTISRVIEEDDVQHLSPQEKARLTTWLIDQRLRGAESPEVTRDVVDFTRRRPSLPADQRADRLLRYLAGQSETVGDQVPLQLQSDTAEESRNKVRLGATDVSAYAVRALSLSDAAAARSESTTFDEIEYFLGFLTNRGWLSVETRTYQPWPKYHADIHLAAVSVDGYSRIGDQATTVDSSQAFVAMWFDESIKDVYYDGIRPAVQDAGYSPLRIDEKPDVDKIDDEIIAEIRRSSFVVADFTHGDKGARGGVYFEAGFAYGLGIPVIYTCRNDMVKDLHFDTRQYAHIVWKTAEMEQFRIKLRNRILARIRNRS